MKHIVKRRGHKEAFDERKIYGSCYAACLGTRMKHSEAEKMCETVCKDVKLWIEKRKEINSTDLFKQMIKTIQKYNKEVAYLYETHRDIM